MAANTNPTQTLAKVKGNREAVGGALKNNDGAAIDLTGKTVTFRMVKTDDGSVKVDDASATIDNATEGLVSWHPVAADVDTEGAYAAYFRIMDSVPRRFPYDGAKFVLNIIDECRPG